MPRVWIAAGCPHATTTLYRCLHLQEQLTEMGAEAVVREWREDNLNLVDEALQYDLMVLQRVAMSAQVRRLIDAAHLQGKKVIFDTDDLIFEPQLIQWHRGVARLTAAEQQLYTEGVHRYQATLEACDYVLTTSALLAELAQKHGKTAFVHRNAIGREMQALGDQLLAQRQKQTREERIVIGYGSGTPTHDVDFEQTAPALLDMMTRYPQVELWLVGPLELPQSLNLLRHRIHRFPLTDWRGWFELVSQFDINLAPLEMNNLFCRAKSEIKFSEAALFEIPTVASRIDPFVYAITPGQNGLLAANMVDWIDALDLLISQPAQRQLMGQAARRTVNEHYSLRARAAELTAILAQMQMNGQSTQLPSEVPANLSESSALHRDKLLDTDDVALLGDKGAAPFVPLVINWLVSEPFEGSGGHTTLFRMIKHLVEFGHECHVYIIPMQDMYHYSPDQLRQYVDQVFMVTRAHFHVWTGQIGDADATIATYWKTVAEFLTLPNTGRRYYFVQDFEPYFYPVGSEYILAENTYRQGLHCITIGPWLAKLMRERYQAEADAFDFAVDLDVYWFQPNPRDHLRVAFYARPSTPRRAYDLGIEALRIVKAQQPQVEIVLYGTNQLASPPPFNYTNLGICTPYELAALYSTCDVGLVLSLTNPSLVPFEMMACRCAVVDVRSERVEGVLDHGQNAMLADPTPEKLAEAILQLLWDKELRQQIVERAYQQTRMMSWRNSARQIEAVLLRHAPAPAQRRANRRLEQNDPNTLLWQIHQLLDQGEDQQLLVDQLQVTLQRVLMEKAQLATRLQQNEATLAQRQARRGIMLPAVWRSLDEQAPKNLALWQLGKHRLSQLSLTPTPLWQTFQADRSHLCRIELRFAGRQTERAGTIHFALYEEDDQEHPLVVRTLMPTEVPTDQPYAIDFEPQPYSFGRTYRFRLASEPGGLAAYSVWRFWTPLHTGATLQVNQQNLRGQVAFQAFYQNQGALVGPRTGPAAWGEPVRLRPVVFKERAAHAAGEARRLARQSYRAWQTHGPKGLLAETINYVRWQLMHMDKE